MDHTLWSVSLSKWTHFLPNQKKKKKKDPRLVLSLSFKCPPPFFPSLLSSHSVHYLHHCLFNFHNDLLDDILFVYLIFKPSFSPYPFYSFKLLMLTIISLYTQELADKRTTYFVSMAVSMISFKTLQFGFKSCHSSKTTFKENWCLSNCLNLIAYS